MNKIYLVRDNEGNEIAAHSKTWCYKTLGDAKAAAKNMIRARNKKRIKGEKLKFAEIKVVECEITKMQEHPI